MYISGDRYVNFYVDFGNKNHWFAENEDIIYSAAGPLRDLEIPAKAS